jgi:hypothetical protein
MAATKRPHRTRAATAHLNELLDEALKETFPASDPIAIDVEPARTRENSEAQDERAAQIDTER